MRGNPVDTRATLQSASKPPDSPNFADPIAAWFRTHRRDLPWRAANVTPWGVLVSEVMLQQTPVARVAPVWIEWMTRWPTPSDLARADSAEVLRRWGKLGYPRRALRLRETAASITADHAGLVPTDEATLRGLPGIGEYTAAAVAAFAFRRRTVVLDTNIRRVLARAVDGQALPPPTLTRSERDRAATLVPETPTDAATWNIGVMELGALVCRAKNPRCSHCPISQQCAWRSAGYPADSFQSKRRSQTFQGTDRQARGALLEALRDADGPLHRVDLARAWEPAQQRQRALDTLVADGLISEHADSYLLGSG